MIRFAGHLYRALHYRSAEQPLSGDWAARFGGRFNRIGRPALYLSLDPSTTLREVVRTRRLQPTVFISFDASLDSIVDARADGLDEAVLAADDWQMRMVEDGISPSQRLADDLVAQGAAGLLVRSFAPNTSPADLNMVLWSWSPADLRIIDDEGRLPPR